VGYGRGTKLLGWKWEGTWEREQHRGAEQTEEEEENEAKLFICWWTDGFRAQHNALFLKLFDWITEDWQYHSFDTMRTTLPGT
jgi:hypothetical protein